MKSMCQDARRNSPSVAVRRPTSCCIRTASRIASSSTARSSSSSSAPSACFPRASSSRCGRSRLPTWSARNGGVSRKLMASPPVAGSPTACPTVSPATPGARAGSHDDLLGRTRRSSPSAHASLCEPRFGPLPIPVPVFLVRDLVLELMVDGPLDDGTELLRLIERHVPEALPEKCGTEDPPRERFSWDALGELWGAGGFLWRAKGVEGEVIQPQPGQH